MLSSFLFYFILLYLILKSGLVGSRSNLINSVKKINSLFSRKDEMSVPKEIADGFMWSRCYLQASEKIKRLEEKLQRYQNLVVDYVPQCFGRKCSFCRTIINDSNASFFFPEARLCDECRVFNPFEYPLCGHSQGCLRCVYQIFYDFEIVCNRCGLYMTDGIYGCEMHDFYICERCAEVAMKWFKVMGQLQVKIHNDRISHWFRNTIEEFENDHLNSFVP